MVWGKLAVPGRPTYLDNIRARATALAVGVVRFFFFFFFFFAVFLSSIISVFLHLLSGRRSDID